MDEASAVPAQVVLVVDFGAQYAQLIARRVREAGVYSEIVPHHISAADVAARAPQAVVLSGGPMSVHAEGAPGFDPGIFDLGVPLLGICYGAQLIAQELGGTVGHSGRGEYGGTEMTRGAGESRLLGDAAAGDTSTVWMSHFDAIGEPPPGFWVTASTAEAPAVIENPDRALYGVQYHPEVAHTEGGQELLTRFLHDVAGCAADWTTTGVIDDSVAAVRAQVGDGRAVCGLSGGVDSAVAAALAHRAIGDRLTCVFVDTGLLRAGEAAQVVETFGRTSGLELVHVDAADEFFDALAGVTDPERKRKIIGERFVRVFERTAASLGEVGFLVQGTLYPDVIESGSPTAAKIKSHHNVGGLPDDIGFEVVEPLSHLFKDEVRAVGEQLGLPEEVVWRQPFPGPGLAVRVVGEVTRESVEIVRAADTIVRAEIAQAGLEREVWQAFTVLVDIRTVGVMGDQRTYARPVVVRAVTSDDAMTADWARLPHELLDRISTRIINEVDGVNRVVYDVTSKPPGTIEWE
ncbi:MAG TPA: GMP synthase (glutamine-hydrolyzing) [Acidimicrobiaceae bacterium]|nr:GMP synthase (glutamine-hydrolyzing) [Acidimicrobiaceae bacterium]HCB37688.1 GMP synthase (glutamine-hydrolyzing) [Acidimicrobiaceae bacterium]